MASALVLLFLLVFFRENSFVLTVRESFLVVGKPLLKLAAVFQSQKSLSGDEIAALLEEERKLKADATELEALKEENQSLKNAQNFLDEKKFTTHGGRVTHLGEELGKEFMLIDLGADQGIKKGDLALDANGFFVGTVAETGDRFSKISLASNPGETFEVEIRPVHLKALARGIGGRIFSIELLPADSVVQRGDSVTLRGIEGEGGGRYSFFLGSLVNVKSSGASAFKTARALLGADPESLSSVFIVESRNK